MDEPFLEQPVLNDSESEFTDLVYALSAPLPGGHFLAGRASGLYRSSDGGQTWQNSLADQPLAEPLPVLSLAVSPQVQQDGILLAGVPGGFFRSQDGGETWQAVLLPNPSPAVSSLACALLPKGEPVFFAGTVEDGVLISQDGGLTWAGWNFGLLDFNTLCLAVSPNFAEDGTLFAGVESGLFRSASGGRAWRDLDLPFGFEAVISLAVSPWFAQDHTVYLGTEAHGLWVSGDEGLTWQPVGAFEDPINAILPGSAPGGLLVLTSGGLWWSVDAGANWTSVLPDALADQEMSALQPAPDIRPGAALYAGTVSGQVVKITLP